MNSKYKVTPFARLLFFLVLFAPIAYLGASYYQGEDGIKNIKEALGLTPTSVADQIASKQAEIHKLEQKIELLKSEVEALRASE